MTTTGSLLNYCQTQWNISAPGSASIIWSDGWFNPLFPYLPQITFSDLSNPEAQIFGTGGSQTFMYRPRFAVNVWNQIPVGANGTAEVQATENMRKEVARIFRTGVGGTYGGSLSPLMLCLPENQGVPRHETDKTPRVLRYELVLVGITQNE
jgi:hypothetical protein